MFPRELEPEVMDTVEEAAAYDTMNHDHVNRVFVDELLALVHDIATPGGTTAPGPCQVLDIGTGTALIPLELCRRSTQISVVGIDLSAVMLDRGRARVLAASLAGRIELQRVDARALPFPQRCFDVVMSNSIVHHIPDPRPVLEEMARVVRPGGLLFVRDLLRPDTGDEVERLVGIYAGDDSAVQQQLFRQSLRASLSLKEARQAVDGFCRDAQSLRQTSDRHWTLAWRRE